MTEIDLDAIRERAEAATQGPWTTGRGHEPGWYPHELIISASAPIIELENSEQGVADADFIAAARTDVPALLGEVERLAAERDRAVRVGDAVGRRCAVRFEETTKLEARIAAAHTALTEISEADDDAFATLESTVEYVVTSYRSIAKSEAQQADLIVAARRERDEAVAEQDRLKQRLEHAWSQGDEDGLIRLRLHSQIKEARAERDRMRPVVEAAREMVEHPASPTVLERLEDVVDTYTAQGADRG